VPQRVCITSPCAHFVACPVLGPALWMFAITHGVSVMNAYPMFSCMRLNPGPDVAVMAFAPAQLAPMTALSAANSSSICMAIPPVCGSLFARCSAISVAGVIGYPAKNLHPAVMAASAHAWFPCMKYVFGGICLVMLCLSFCGCLYVFCGLV